MSRSVSFAAIVVFGLGAAAGLWLAQADYRSGVAGRVLARADAAEANERTARMTEAAGFLGASGPTGSLRELQARLAAMQTPPDIELAQLRSEQALARSPARKESWARLAYAEAAQNGALTPEGLAALNRSFVTAPFATRSFQLWRIEFGLSYWPSLDDEAKSHIGRALAALAALPGARPDANALQEMADRLPYPEARQFLLPQD